MFYIVENEQQFTDFKNISVKDHFIYPIYEDDRVHPVLNKVIAIYVYSYYLSKSFIISISHPDCQHLDESSVLDWISKENVVVTANAKYLLHWVGDSITDNIIDLKFENKNIDDVEDNQRKWYYNLYKGTKQVNQIIPITLHKRFYDKFLETGYWNGYGEVNLFQSKLLKSLSKIEKQGLLINKKLFKEKYPDADLSYNFRAERIYTWYNVYNPTTRLSNNFNSINFAALSKNTGIRNGILAEENSNLIELDYRAYHPYLLADKLGITFDENPYMYLAKHFYKTENPTEEHYNKSKLRTFQVMYTDDPTYDYIEFIKKGKELRHKLFDEQLGTLDEKQILPFYLQRLETERNAEVMEKVVEFVLQTNIKLILHTYDSLLFNVPKDSHSDFLKLLDLVEDPKYPIKITYGKDYGSMKEM